MLQIGKTYKDNNGREIVIAGRIKNYSAFMPFVWALQGDWYDEQTGRRYATGESITGIAKDFPVNRGSISKVVRRKSWSHV